MHEFEMIDMGLLHFFLGIEVNKKGGGIFITQKYAKELLKMFRLKGVKPISTLMEVGLKLSNRNTQKRVDGTFYRSLVGSIMYLTVTRLDICSWYACLVDSWNLLRKDTKR